MNNYSYNILITMKYKLFISLLATLFSFEFCFAQQYWTLEKCIMHAMENNIMVNQSLLGIDRAEVSYSRDKQQRYPGLNGSTSASLSFGRSINPITNDFVTESFFSNSYGLNTGMTLFNGGVINNSIKQSRVNLEAAQQDAEQTRINIALQVANAYLQVLFAEENVDLAGKQLELSEQQLDQMNKYIRAGVRPEAERLNLEAQIKRSEQGIIDAENNLVISLLSLKQLLRLPPDEDMEILVPENIQVTTDPDMITFSEAFNEAVKNRPDLRAEALRVKSAELAVNIAKGNYYPNISLGGALNTNYARASGFDAIAYSKQLDANLSYGVGATVNIPIYNNGNVKSNVQQAQIGVENAILNQIQVEENLKTNVQQALANARASKKRLEASQLALEAQELAFENTTKKLEIGAANTFEWEAQKTQTENAEISRLIDKYNYLFDIKILEFYLGKPLKI